MKKSTVMALLITNGFAYYGVVLVAYMHLYYYDAAVAALNATNTQFGLLISIVGITALVSYIFGGPIADKVETKKLLMIAYAVQIFVLIAYSFFLPFAVTAVIQIVASIASMMLYWSAMAKYVRSLGDPSQEARLYGLHYAVVGISGTLMGFVGAGMIGAFGAVTGLRVTLYISAAVLLLAIVINHFIYNPKKVEITEEEKFKLSNVGYILKMPLFWLVALAGACLYLVSAMLVYFAPMLSDNFGAPLALVSAVGIFRMYFAKMVFCPLGGYIIDKNKSSVRFMGWLMIVAVIGGIGLMISPWNSSAVIPAVIILIALTAVFNMSIPTWFTPLTDIRIPDHMRGTGVGLLSAVMFASDAFIYVIAGHLIDTLGVRTGYLTVFGGLTAFFVVGIILAFIAYKKIKKLPQNA